MIFLILMFVIEAGILIVLLNSILGDEVELLPALIIAICTIIGWGIIDGTLEIFFPGIVAFALAVTIVSVSLGAVLSLFLGSSLKSSCLAALAFMACHILLSLGMLLFF